MLRLLEDVLQVEFTIIIKEKEMTMNRIRMGNDELILHIRKHYNCTLDNPTLGRRIWKWLEENAEGEQQKSFYEAPWMLKIPEDQNFPAVSAKGLPKGGVMFEFNITALPCLYIFLAELGGTRKNESDYIRGKGHAS
jgi:hypothetical protein